MSINNDELKKLKGVCVKKNGIFRKKDGEYYCSISIAGIKKFCGYQNGTVSFFRLNEKGDKKIIMENYHGCNLRSNSKSIL